MAIGAPVERYAVRAVFNGSVQAINPATTIAAGTVAIVIAHGGGVFANGDNKLSSVTDSKGNTWVVDHTYGPNTTANSISFAHGIITTAVTSADTVTLTWTVSGNVNRSIWIQEVTGLAVASTFDTFADNTGNSTTPTTGPTATLAQADEIVFCTAGNTTNNSTWTPGATYTSVTTPQLALISGLEYKIVAATTAVAGAGNWSPLAVQYNMSVATYKGLLAPPPSAGGRRAQPLVVLLDDDSDIMVR